MPLATGHNAAHAEIKCEATNQSAVWEVAVAEIAEGADEPTTVPLPPSLVALPAGVGIVRIITPNFPVTPGRSYIVAARKVSGAGSLRVYSANLILVQQ